MTTRPFLFAYPVKGYENFEKLSLKIDAVMCNETENQGVTVRFSTPENPTVVIPRLVPLGRGVATVNRCLDAALGYPARFIDPVTRLPTEESQVSKRKAFNRGRSSSQGDKSFVRASEE